MFVDLEAFAKALVQILQRRDDPRLPKTREMALNEARDKIEAAVEEGSVSGAESKRLTEIIETALQGDPEEARQSLRELMNAQIDR